MTNIYLILFKLGKRTCTFACLSIHYCCKNMQSRFTEMNCMWRDFFTIDCHDTAAERHMEGGSLLCIKVLCGYYYLIWYVFVQ